MIKNMCLTAGLVLGSTTAANACSYHFPPNFNFQYETLEQGTMNTRWAWQGGKSEQPLTNLISNLDILMIARPAEDQIVTDKPKEWWVNDNDDREYRRIRWDVLRYIKGNSLTPLYVRDPKGKIYPTLAQDTETTSSESKAGLSQSSARKEFIEAIETRIVDRKSFAFWDAPVLKDIMMVDVTQFTSCGEVPVPAFDFNRFYIVGIDKNGATAFAEPLSNENDPLIAGVERIVSSGKFSPDMPVERFLNEMEFRDVVEIKSCGLDLQNRNATSKHWIPYSEKHSYGAFNSSQFESSQDIKFSRTGMSTESDIDIEDLSNNYPALLEYFNKDKAKVACQAGEIFAVYGDTDINESPNHFGIAPTIPKYRFARVEDGNVSTDDIITNYTITGPSYITIADFRHPKVQR